MPCPANAAAQREKTNPTAKVVIAAATLVKRSCVRIVLLIVLFVVTYDQDVASPMPDASAGIPSAGDAAAGYLRHALSRKTRDTKGEHVSCSPLEASS